MHQAIVVYTGTANSTVYVQYDPQLDARPVVFHRLCDGPFHATFPQVSRLVSGLIGREVKVVRWLARSGVDSVYGTVVFKGEKY